MMTVIIQTRDEMRIVDVGGISRTLEGKKKNNCVFDLLFESAPSCSDLAIVKMYPDSDFSDRVTVMIH